jgi:hypothetical protein
LNPKSIVTAIPQSIDALTKLVDQKLENVPKWKVLALSAGLTATSICLYNYYLDIDTGIDKIKYKTRLKKSNKTM